MRVAVEKLKAEVRDHTSTDFGRMAHKTIDCVVDIDLGMQLRMYGGVDENIKECGGCALCPEANLQCAVLCACKMCHCLDARACIFLLKGGEEEDKKGGRLTRANTAHARAHVSGCRLQATTPAGLSATWMRLDWCWIGGGSWGACRRGFLKRHRAAKSARSAPGVSLRHASLESGTFASTAPLRPQLA